MTFGKLNEALFLDGIEDAYEKKYGSSYDYHEPTFILKSGKLVNMPMGLDGGERLLQLLPEKTYEKFFYLPENQKQMYRYMAFVEFIERGNVLWEWQESTLTLSEKVEPTEHQYRQIAHLIDTYCKHEDTVVTLTYLCNNGKEVYTEYAHQSKSSKRIVGDIQFYYSSGDVPTDEYGQLPMSELKKYFFK